MSNITQWIGYVLGGLTFFATVGAIHTTITAARSKRKYPPPGQLIDIGDCRLHVNRMGIGEPIVVIESGSGNFSLDWSVLQPEIAKLTRVCTYDRAGHGWSDAGAKPRTVPQIVEELHTLLKNTGTAGPYVLVGHSLGGLYMQYFARRYPTETAGMVLVDSSYPDLYLHLPPVFLRKNEVRLRKMWLAAIFGILQLRMLSMPSAPKKLMPNIQRIISTLWLSPLFWRTLIDQNKYLTSDMPDLFCKVGPFPDIPLIVLTAANNDWLSGISPEFPALWLESQEKLSNLSPRGKLIIVKDSGHDIHHDQSESVVDVIRQVIELARR